MILALTSREMKSKFFDNFEVLKSKGLSIANDMTKEERENYKKLKAIKIELFNYGIQNKIAKGKIIINNNECEVEEALKFLEEIKKEETINSEQKERGYTSDTSSVISDIPNTFTERNKIELNVEVKNKGEILKIKNNLQKNKINDAGYMSDSSNVSTASKKRNRQESKSPEECKEKKMVKRQYNSHNKVTKHNQQDISQYCTKNNNSQPKTTV